MYDAQLFRATLAYRAIMRECSRAIVALEDAHRFDLSSEAEELLLDVVRLHRELLELPAETGVPPALEDAASSSEDVPF